MSKNKKQKRRKLLKKLLRLRPPEVLPDQDDFPKGKWNRILTNPEVFAQIALNLAIMQSIFLSEPNKVR